MPTLYVENVPADLYAALRKRAKQNRTSIASEVISLLKQNVPTAAQLKKRREFYDYVMRLKETSPPSLGPFPSAEEMIREDRER
jgi:antitoxin FitA-like protein